MMTARALSLGLVGVMLLSASPAVATSPLSDPVSATSPAVATPPPADPIAATSPTVATSPAVATPPRTEPVAVAVQKRLLEEGQHFSFDPVSDGVLTAAGFGFAGLLGLILGTGELKPPVPVTGVSLLPMDRTAITQTIDPNAATISNVVLYSAVGWAVLDPILSGFRDGTDALIVDAFMYAESGSLALTVTDITKIAVRRPRPIDYIACGTAAQQAGAGCNSSDLGLSFFSGHAASVAAIGATASYIAFVRSPDGIRSPRPWITLGLATALTALVSFERVRAGDHFPTDVIAGSMAGAAIGVIVPHLHRHREEAPPVWIGVAPAPGGGALSLQGVF